MDKVWHSVSRLLQRAYIRVIRLVWRVEPASLFDAQYYTSTYPDVATGPFDPLFHFLRYGAAERRKPHPLFDTDFYLANNRDVARSRHNPLLHFLRYGGFEGRQPHRRFDAEFYLSHYPDVAESQINPLLHFVKYGAAQGRLTRRPVQPTEDFLPVRHATTLADRSAPEGVTIDVVVPAYKGVAETKTCIESVLAGRCLSKFHLIVVNDRSPEPELTRYLQKLAAQKKITLIENSQNLGFVRSANAGMQAAAGDVVLLNSDTIVFDGWVDRLAACAYSGARIGTVTPFSNNASICSYPLLGSDNHLPPEIDLARLDQTFATVNAGRSVDMPTAVGFCMYIRRDCLNETGLFDAETFGMGYGEENDFCIRATAKGWTHKLACDVFVHHAGGVSFGDFSVHQKSAMQILTRKHSAYMPSINRYVAADPASAYRIAVTAYRIKKSGKRVFLSVAHPLGGGTAQHARDLASCTADDVIWINLQPIDVERVRLECVRDGYQFSIRLERDSDHELVATLVKACGVQRVHIQHLMGHGPELERLIRELELPFDFTAHDYFTVCPQVTLSDKHGRYCGEPDEHTCDDCMDERPPQADLVDIKSWRSFQAWAVTDADRVIAPSIDCRNRLQKYFPSTRIVAAEHESPSLCKIPSAPPLGERDRLRVAVLGTMTVHKGFELLRDCANYSKNNRLPLEFILIGGVEGEISRQRLPFSITGPYQSSELRAILSKTAPHIVWFPAQLPETFSYTLSACFEFGIPVAVPDLGVFPERVGSRPWTWIVPPTWSAIEWAKFFNEVRGNFISRESPAPPPLHPRAMADFYPDQYLNTSNVRSAPRIVHSGNSSKTVIAAAVSTATGGQIQACGYVRVIQPLTHPVLANHLELKVVNTRSLVNAEADVILIQRDAVRDFKTADEIISACLRRGTRLLYEIDDDLFDISLVAPEIQNAMRHIAAAADTVIVSTETLRQQMLRYNPSAVTIPNYLDDRLWKLSPNEPVIQGGPCRVLYTGTTSHANDLEFLGTAIRRMNPALREKLRLDVIGVAEKEMSTDWFRAIPVRSYVAASYPRYVKWLQTQTGCHWGVAPLLDTPFNRSKSSLKFLEYSALRLPAICSDVTPYREAVRHQETGLLIANDPAEWANTLELVVQNAEVAHRLRAQCPSIFHQNTITANAETLRSRWLALTQDRPVSATSGI